MNHHAYLYEGSISLLTQLADDAAGRFDFKREGNPDVLVQQWEKFGIEEARELAQRASLKSMSGKSLFVLGISSITSEAQQALLKLFEEPNVGLVFVVLTPPGLFMATLKSRFLPYETTLAVENESLSAAKKFLQASQKDRSAMIADLLDEEENIKERVRDFLNALETLLAPKLSESPAVRKSLEDITAFRSYINDRSPSLKMILEHFAATLYQPK